MALHCGGNNRSWHSAPGAANWVRGGAYTLSPLKDSHLFGPSPWKVLATTYERKRFLSNPAPGENIISGNIVIETGCTCRSNFRDICSPFWSDVVTGAAHARICNQCRE